MNDRLRVEYALVELHGEVVKDHLENVGLAFVVRFC